MKPLRLLPKLSELSKFQREEYAKLWFDLAKISAGSLVIKGFEPKEVSLDWGLLLTLAGGLAIFVGCIKVGLTVAEGVNNGH